MRFLALHLEVFDLGAIGGGEGPWLVGVRGGERGPVAAATGAAVLQREGRRVYWRLAYNILETNKNIKLITLSTFLSIRSSPMNFTFMQFLLTF